ncbi:MAG: hypothetical protein LUD38_07560 [Parabacteroides sp.]|nr:hypothetical protein [Parabacteroides sp.]
MEKEMLTTKLNLRTAALAAAAALFCLSGLASAVDYCCQSPRPVVYQPVTVPTVTTPSYRVYETRAVMNQSSPDFLIPTTHGIVETRDPGTVFNNPVDNYYQTYSRAHNYGSYGYYYR